MWSNGICTDQKWGEGAMCGAMVYVLIRKEGGGLCVEQWHMY